MKAESYKVYNSSGKTYKFIISLTESAIWLVSDDAKFHIGAIYNIHQSLPPNVIKI